MFRSGGQGRSGKRERERGQDESCTLHKKPTEPISSIPPAKSDFWPTMLSSELKKKKKSKNLTLLGTIIMFLALLPELLTIDLRHITVRGYELSTSERKPPSRWQTPSVWEKLSANTRDDDDDCYSPLSSRLTALVSDST